MNLLETVMKVASGTMGVDDVLAQVGLRRQVVVAEKIPVALNALVDAVSSGAVEVHEVTGTIKGVPVSCIVVAKGKIQLA